MQVRHERAARRSLAHSQTRPKQRKRIDHQHRLTMCMKTECPTCHKPTWRGCGMHIESALSGVKEEDRCPNWKTGKHYLPGQEPQGWCTVQ